MRVLLVFLTMLTSIEGAMAAERAALVIGNQKYAFAPLDTPENDARAMTDRLRRAGYQVTRLLNQRQSDMYDGIDRFFAQHRQAKVLLFYYAGHAVQLNGKNFLIPVDSRKDDPDILSRMFDLRYLLNKLTESRSETNLVILDACRDNLFSSHPSAASGLSELIAPPGTLVAFSTAPGSTAEDGDGENSPYTKALIESLFRPGAKIEDSFKEIRRKVRLLTKNVQTPWESTSLEKDFHVVPFGAAMTQPKGITRSSSAEIRRPAQASSRSMAAAMEYERVIDKKYCSRILAKISMGMEQLSENETASLAKCRH